VIQDRGRWSLTTKPGSAGFSVHHSRRTDTRSMKLPLERRRCRSFQHSVRISSISILVFLVSAENRSRAGFVDSDVNDFLTPF